MVELTDEEKELAMKDAMVRKHAQLESDRKKALAEAARKNRENEFNTPNDLYRLAAWRATQILRYRTGNPTINFQPMEFQQPVITALSLYFTNSIEFQQLNTKDYNTNKYEFSLQKGLWLWGNPGVGKSLIMEMFNRNTRLCFDIVQCPKLCYNYVKHGDDILQQYINPVPAYPGPENFYQHQAGVCYNDLGTESMQSKHYGNAINVMEYIILESYEKKVPYFHRHVTTNLTFDQVKEYYGVRVLDRIKECFNIIEVRGESLRGKSF